MNSYRFIEDGNHENLDVRDAQLLSKGKGTGRK